MNRPPWDEFWFKVAADYATRATCPRASIGAVIVNPRTHRQMGAGYNGAAANEPHCADVGCTILAQHCVRATHAEINAAGQVQAGYRDLVAYVVGGREVCSHCARELYAVGVREVKWRESVHTLDSLAREIRAWSAVTFPGSTAASTAEHLRREVFELLESPANAEEQADVFFLLVQLTRVTGTDFATQVARKLTVNKARRWALPDQNGVVEHVRGEVPA